MVIRAYDANNRTRAARQTLARKFDAVTVGILLGMFFFFFFSIVTGS